jgi:hypothetical protein
MAVDASFANTGLLLHAEGPNNSTSTTDQSASPKTITFVGAAKISTAQALCGTSSLLFGAGDRISTPAHADFQFGTGDFTIEATVYVTAFPSSGFNGQIIGLHRYGLDNLWILSTNSDGTVTFYNAVGTFCTTTLALSLNTEHAVALTRQGTTVRLFIDGVLRASVIDTHNYGSYSHALTIGGDATGDSRAQFLGYIDEVRVTKGVARYASAYTVATEPFPHAGAADPLVATSTFGTPNAAYARIGVATGADPSTQLGTPDLLHKFLGATGEAPATTFGDAVAIYDRFQDATGIAPATALGTPARLTLCEASGIVRTSVVSPAYYPFYQTREASGFESGAAGQAIAIRYSAVPLARASLARSFRSTAMGTPTAARTVTGVASSIAPTAAIGAPGSDTLNQTVQASSVAPGHALGAPAAFTVHHASGWVATVLGTPLATLTVYPAGIAPAAAFGAPTLSRPDVYHAYSNPSRAALGHPVALQRFNKPATGIASTNAFGAPQASARCRALPFVGVTSFGEALVRRSA